MPVPRYQRHLFVRVTWALLALLVVGVPMMAGGVHPPAQAFAAIAAGLLLVVHGLARRQDGRRVVPGALPWVLAAGAAWSALQALPLPLPLLELLSPAAAELHTFMAWEAPARWGAVSVEPLATLVAAGQLLTCAVVLTVCHDLARDDDNRPRLAWLVVVAAALGVVLGVVHELADWRRLLTLVETPYRPLVVAPFVNPNHSAAFMNLGALAALGLALHGRVPVVRVGLVLLAAIFALRTVPARSFGANASLVVGMLGVVWAANQALRSRHSASENAGTVPIRVSIVSFVIALGAVLATTLDLDAASTFAAARHALVGKLEMMGESAAITSTYWLSGVGRGAFEHVFPRHMTVDRNLTFVGPENLEILLVVEWGLPFALGYMFAFVVPFFRVRWEDADALARVGFAVTVATALHNQIDFSLETLGVALPFLALVATVGLPSSSRRREDPKPAHARRAIVGGVAIATVAAVPALVAIRHDVEASRERALQAPAAHRVAALEEHLRWHRTDYVAALSLARAIHTVRPDDHAGRLAWINRALYLRPPYSQGHFDAARALWDLGARDQAILELRLAANAHEPPVGLVFHELLRRRATVNEMLTVFSERSLWLCDQLARNSRLGAAFACIQQATTDNARGNEIIGLAELARRLGDVVQAERLARDALRRTPDDPAALFLLSRILEELGDVDEATALLQRASERGNIPDVQRAQFRSALARGNKAAALVALERLGRALQAESKPLSEVMLGEAQLEEKLGDPARALQRYRDAARAYPADAGGAINAARLAEGMGRTALGITILQEAYASHPLPAYERRLDELKRR